MNVKYFVVQSRAVLCSFVPQNVTRSRPQRGRRQMKLRNGTCYVHCILHLNFKRYVTNLDFQNQRILSPLTLDQCIRGVTPKITAPRAIYLHYFTCEKHILHHNRARIRREIGKVMDILAIFDTFSPILHKFKKKERRRGLLGKTNAE